MKFDISKILENRKATAVLSVMIAVILWFSVVLVIDTQDTVEYKGVPVRLDAVNSTAGKIGLRPLIPEDEPKLVNVTITGSKAALGYVNKEDIYVTAPISHITVAGNHTLTYAGSDINGKGFEVVSISPAAEEIYFDNWVTRVLSVSFPKEGLEIPEDYLMEQEIIDPEIIEITGPDSILAEIDSCVIEYHFDDPLTTSFSRKLPLAFYDVNGERMDDRMNPAFVRLNAMGGDELPLPGEVQVVLQILKRKTLPVKVELVGVPDGFNPDSVAYTLSEREITLAGPEADIESREEFPIGNIDMREVGLPGYEREIKLTLLPGYSNVNEIETITVEFPLEGYEQKSLNVSNIVVINEPAGYDITVDARQITGVEVVGPASVLRSLTAADLIAVIDMTKIEPVTGQRRAPVEIQISGRDNVWVYGKHDAMITVSRKDA